jgi:hypothetical protein
MANFNFFKTYIQKKIYCTQALKVDVIGYKRVSSKQQVANYGISEQESAIIEYCRSNRYHLTGIIGDTYFNR